MTNEAKPAPLQQGEYLPLPEPAIKACHCYSTNQVREAIDADRASRGAAQAAPAPVAEDAEDGARFRAMINAALNEDEAFARIMQAEKSEPTTLDEVRALVDKARAQAAQPEGGANG